MKQGIIIAVIVVVLIIGAATLLSKQAAEPEATTEPVSLAPPAASAPIEQAAQAIATVAAEGVAEAQAAIGGALTAATLPGTQWKYDAYTVAFKPNGALTVNSLIPGTWKVEGSKLFLSVLGENITLAIEGDKLLADGNPVQRVK